MRQQTGRGERTTSVDKSGNYQPFPHGLAGFSTFQQAIRIVLNMRKPQIAVRFVPIKAA